MKWLKWLRRAGSWLRRNWCIVSVPVTAVLGILLSVCFWEELHGQGSVSETIRNLGLVIGGVIAIQLAIWRSKVAERQADTAQQGLLNERYQKGAEMLGSSVPAVRLGGIYALQGLDKKHPKQYHVQIMRLFCAFVRHPTEDKDGTAKSTDANETASPELDRIREDVQAAMKPIGTRSKADMELEREEGLRPDLSGANLTGAILSETNLASANLTRANLTEAALPGADLTEADLSHANLTRADLASHISGLPPFTTLHKADLTGADLTDADLSRAKLIGAKLPGANLTGATLRSADLTGAYLIAVKGLTQAQLDKACADPGKPPNLDSSLDAKTKAQLVWRGKQCKDA